MSLLTRVQWAQRYYADAAAAAAGSGVFPLTLLTQAIIESQGQVNGVYYPGQSALAKNYNNYFGIKGSGSAGSVSLPTREYINGQYVTVNANFARYHNIQDSFRGYITFLRSNPRYTAAGVFQSDNYQTQLQRIAAAGYATDPNYANMLVNVANNLLDDLADQIAAAPGKNILLPLGIAATLIYLLS
jgi:flagellum-specific peptidoglycan hydrolase FlgJ